MKHKGLIAAVILPTAMLFASCYNPRNYDDENDFIVTVQGETAEITGYIYRNYDVKIPPRIGKHTVISIGDDAFKHYKLTGVKIPAGVKRIGERAFMSSQLNHVVIPQTITEIGYSAFAYNNLTEIVLPDHLTEIEEKLFKDNKLTSIRIPENIRTIGDYAFENNRLTELIIPESVVSIGRSAFGYYSHDTYGRYDDRNIITKVTIGDNVELDMGAIRGFTSFYDSAVRKRGGTYIYSDHHWRPEDKNIPVYIFNPDKGWQSPDIKFLQDMPDLKDITLKNNDFLTDITPLSKLTNIKGLRIYNCPNIENIKPLASLVNLESLFLTHNNNYDYGDIDPLQKLEELFIRSDRLGEIDLISIGHLPYLKSLTLISGHVETIKNIDKLQNLTSLESLEIAGVKNLDLSWAASLRNLTDLRITSSAISDISPLASLPNLIEVNLAGNIIKDITPLLYSNSIEHITVYAHEVKAGISDTLRSQFQQKGIYLDTFYDDR